MRVQCGWAAVLAALVLLGGCSSRSVRPQTEVVESVVTRTVQLAPVPPELLKPLKVGDEIEYQVIDKYTGRSNAAVFRVDKVQPDQVVFNQGARVEKPDGELLRLTTVVAGDMDAISPPRGWGNDRLEPEAYWRSTHQGNGAAQYLTYSLKAEAGQPTNLQTPMGLIPVVFIEYWGWVTDKARTHIPPSKVSIKLWYAPALKRVIRMESNVRAMGNTAPRTYENSRELIELVAIRRN